MSTCQRRSYTDSFLYLRWDIDVDDRDFVASWNNVLGKHIRYFICKISRHFNVLKRHSNFLKRRIKPILEYANVVFSVNFPKRQVGMLEDGQQKALCCVNAYMNMSSTSRRRPLYEGSLVPSIVHSYAALALLIHHHQQQQHQHQHQQQQQPSSRDTHTVVDMFKLCHFQQSSKPDERSPFGGNWTTGFSLDQPSYGSILVQVREANTETGSCWDFIIKVAEILGNTRTCNRCGIHWG